MTKKKIEEKCRDILYSYLNNVPLSTEDEDFMLSVFEMHPNWGKKMGCGINYICVGNATYGTKCFFIVRNDGSSTDISFKKCITSKNEMEDIYKACRYAIEPIIIDFKSRISKDFGKIKCEFTGEVLFRENTHIDHYNKDFKDVVIGWLSDNSYSLEYLQSKINPLSDNEFYTYFTDDSLIDSFVKYHNSNTHLRAISKFANLSIRKKTKAL